MRHLINIAINAIAKERGPLSELRAYLESASIQMAIDEHAQEQHRKRMEWFTLTDWERVLVLRSELEQPQRATPKGMPVDLALNGGVPCLVNHAQIDTDPRPMLLPWATSTTTEAIAVVTVSEPYAYRIKFATPEAQAHAINRALNQIKKDEQ